MSDTAGSRAEVLRTRDFVGWAVTGGNGANVGTVSDLLIDRQGQVRFLAVDRGFFRKNVLIPVEALDWGEGSLRTEWTDADVRALPVYDADRPLTAEVLDELRRAYPRYYRTGGPPPPVIDASAPRVVPLKEAKDFRLSKGAPNLRGWTLYGSDHERLGSISDMLVDPVGMRVRYVEVDVERDLYSVGGDRRVLVPMEAVELRERSEDAFVRGLTAREVANLPAHLGGPVDPLVEEAVDRAFGLGGPYGQGGDETEYLPPRDAPPPLPPRTSSGIPVDVVDRGPPPSPGAVDDVPPADHYGPPASDAAPPPLPSSGVPGDAPPAGEPPRERWPDGPPPHDGHRG